MFQGFGLHSLHQQHMTQSGFPLLGKTAYIQRMKILFRGKKAQQVARNCAKKFRSVCLKVIKNKGAAAGN